MPDIFATSYGPCAPNWDIRALPAATMAAAAPPMLGSDSAASVVCQCHHRNCQRLQGALSSPCGCQGTPCARPRDQSTGGFEDLVFNGQQLLHRCHALETETGELFELMLASSTEDVDPSRLSAATLKHFHAYLAALGTKEAAAQLNDLPPLPPRPPSLVLAGV